MAEQKMELLTFAKEIENSVVIVLKRFSGAKEVGNKTYHTKTIL